MISDVMLYGAAIAALLAVAGLALERIAAWCALPRRGAWAVTLILSVALPTMKLLAPHQPAPPPAITVAPTNLRSEETSRIATAAVRVSTDTAPSSLVEPRPRHYFLWPTQASLEKLLRPLWLASSLGLLGFYALLWLRLRVAARQWRRVQLEDQEVWVTQTLGPAVYGFIQPIILMPQWVIDGPDVERALVLAHEQQHIVARDPGWLLLGLLLVTIAPWNLPLWWQLRRLRFAMEVDCDARVLGRGAEARAYGQVLLSIGQRRSFAPAGAIALTEPASQLLRRIRIMTTPIPKQGKWLLGAAVGLSLTCLAVAAELQAPVLQATASTSSAAGQSEESDLNLGGTGVNATWVLIPSGKFVMGATDKQRATHFEMIHMPQEEIETLQTLIDSAGPAHEVYLDAFYIFKFDVTNSQYETFVRATGHRDTPAASDTRFNGTNQPVVRVTWNDASSFCTWAGARLPTEAEWEKAARGTDGRIYPWGNNWDATKLRSAEGIAHEEFAGTGEWQKWRRANIPYSADAKPADVGSYPQGASPYGVMDMAGNVFQWVADWWDPSYYANSPKSNPKGPAGGDFRVLRGGAWDLHRAGALSWERAMFMPPSDGARVTGFRCAKEAKDG
jgi:formylglycine-generating enzyme required for sulfatase activity